MMFWNSGVIKSIFCGSIWASIWQVLFTIIVILVWQNSIKLEIGSAIFTGIFISLIYVFIPLEKRNKYFIYILSFLYFFIFILISQKLPFSVSENFTLLKSCAFTLILAGVVSFSIIKNLKNVNWNYSSRYSSEKFYLNMFWGIGLVFFICIITLPFYIMLLTSFKNSQSLLINPLDFSINFSLPARELFSSYIELFVEYNFLTFLINSTIVSFATVFITLFFSIPGAYAVSRLKFKGRAFLSRSILLIYLIPAIILVVPLYAVFSQLGLRNSLLGLCIVYPATTIPVALYMLKGYFSSLPTELDDAGLIDGLSHLQIILKIILPLSLPALTSVSLYVFMIAWNEFLFSFMFLDDIDLFTLSRGIVSLNDSEIPRQHLMAGSVIATIPVIILFLILEKFLISGLTSGSVKG